MIYILIMLLLISCSDWDTKLVLTNKSNKVIREYHGVMNLNDSIPNLTLCNKTILYDIHPNSEEILRTQNKWNLYLKEQPNKILRIFIINEDSLSKYGTCKVFKDQIFMKRYDFTYDELEKLNWRIVHDDNW